MYPLEKDRITDILSEIETPVEDPEFHRRVFVSLIKEQKKTLKQEPHSIRALVGEEYGQLSYRLDESDLQESCSVRNVLKTRAIAQFLIDDQGNLKFSSLPLLIQEFQEHLYSLGPQRQHDAKRNEHILNVLMQLKENRDLQRQLKAISRPLGNRSAEEVIRETLQIPPKTMITDAHTRRAVLSAWLCYLRQNVGSCFATAPAILVHTEQPAVFLKDLNELLSTGRLKRTFGGNEYTVPMSYNWGAGDLRRVFVFRRGEVEPKILIWKSPGFQSALESVGILDKELPVKEKNKICRQLVVNLLLNWHGEGAWILVSTEELLRKILLAHIGLTEEELAEYELRPKGMIHEGLLMAVSSSIKESGSIGKRCVLFLEQFSIAKNAFKILADNALLKSWEFTLASFSETKLQFTTWNLYSSLGLRFEDKGGIGPCLYDILKTKLDACNEKANALQTEYEQAYAQVQFSQARLRRASSEEEARWLKIEYQTRINTFESIDEMRNTYHYKAKRYANLYNALVDLYFDLFPRYFQEIYDPDILEVVVGPFDDSPAGFRLLYKYGRGSTAQWTAIHNHPEFIEALSGFFTSTESEIAKSEEMQGLESDVGEITSAIISHVHSKEFIETAFWRMAQTHNAPLIKDPLENLDKIEKKPWVYTSGGALTTLVSCYFCLDNKPTESSRWVENPMELAVFLVDCVKGLSNEFQESFVQNRERSLLVHSPTHAFLLKPGYSLFEKCWRAKEFTYTWMRDQVFRPMEYFLDRLYIDADHMRFVTERLTQEVPESHRHYFRQTFLNIGGAMRVMDYRQHLVDTMEITQGLQLSRRSVLASVDIDSLLYRILPLFPSYKLKERVEYIISQLPEVDAKMREALMFHLDAIAGKYGAQQLITADGLQSIVKAMLSLIWGKTFVSRDLSRAIAEIAQKEQFAMPRPLIFADTNWVKDYFAFLISPGTGKLELWRVDYTGSNGAPMSDWTQWLNGSRRSPDWGVYVKPPEYRLHVESPDKTRF